MYDTYFKIEVRPYTLPGKSIKIRAEFNIDGEKFTQEYIYDYNIFKSEFDYILEYIGSRFKEMYFAEKKSSSNISGS